MTVARLDYSLQMFCTGRLHKRQQLESSKHPVNVERSAPGTDEELRLIHSSHRPQEGVESFSEY